jgi:fibronectin type 3 domain-containing protein
VVDVGNVTAYAVTNLGVGTTYYFAVTAYNTSGVESSFSNEVSKSIY